MSKKDACIIIGNKMCGFLRVRSNRKTNNYDVNVKTQMITENKYLAPCGNFVHDLVGDIFVFGSGMV